MNIEKIKEFIALREELYATGVIGLDVYNDRVQVTKTLLVSESDLRITNRDCDEFPHKVSVIRDGINIFAILSNDELQEFYPQFADQIKEEESTKAV